MLNGLRSRKEHLVNLEDASRRLQRVTCFSAHQDTILIANGYVNMATVKVSDIEKVAEELGVEERDGVWDFGDYIIRKE